MITIRGVRDMLSAEAAEAQRQMDALDAATDQDLEAYGYLRGRRDGFESSAFEIDQWLATQKPGGRKV